MSDRGVDVIAEPTVSVLMTAYNREQFIGEAIESVLNSSYSDFELIIVDDCSTDNTVGIVREYAAQDVRIQVHINKSNLGDYPNRNRAASLAKGVYLKYVDSDDIIYPHGLATMVDCMERFPGAGMGLQRPPDRTGAYPVRLTPHQAYYQHFVADGSVFGEGPTAMIIRKESFLKVGGFSGMRYAGDAEFSYRISAQFPIVKIPYGQVWWRLHGNQEFVLGNESSDGYAVLNFTAARDALTADHCPLSPKEQAYALRVLRRRQSRRILRMVIRERQMADARTVKENSGLSWWRTIKLAFCSLPPYAP